MKVTKKKKYNVFKADIWAYGCTVLEMLTGKLPWHTEVKGISNEEKYDAMFHLQTLIRDGTLNFPNEVNNQPLQAKNFLMLCFEGEEKRPSIDELLKHQFLCGDAEVEEDNLDFGYSGKIIDPIYFDLSTDEDDDIVHNELNSVYNINDDLFDEQKEQLKKNEEEKYQAQRIKGGDINERIEEYYNKKLVDYNDNLKLLVREKKRKENQHLKYKF
mmetsp:Transcript_3303/g.4882  ORF Transcript_3303/g.4882 Transcript_3303/m.4882 type:complete len:215 (+) Transcript_3303:1-645(+)